MQKRVIKFSAADRLDSEFDKLVQMEKSIPTKINKLKNDIDDELKKLMIASDRVLFEFGNLKDDIEALVGTKGLQSWYSANNGKENYADMVQKAIVKFRSKLDSLKYTG
jgi:uncharacterized protein YeeX (DUF496 family)